MKQGISVPTPLIPRLLVCLFLLLPELSASLHSPGTSGNSSATLHPEVQLLLSLEHPQRAAGGSDSRATLGPLQQLIWLQAGEKTWAWAH